MSTSRTLRGGFVNVEKLPRGPSGLPLCRNGCGCETPGSRNTFCGPECVHGWRLRTNASYQRARVFLRDRGVCKCCGVDTRSLLISYQQARHLGEVLPLDGQEQALAGRIPRARWALSRALDGSRFAAVEVRAHLLGFDPERKTWWDMDHVRPVVEGGGVADGMTPDEVLANLRTLCIPCHKNATRDLAKRRARGRQPRRQKARSTSRDVGGDRARWISREQLVGKVVGRWTVTGLATREGYVLATCECGTASEVNASNLVSGQSKSCGCRRHAPTIRTHGQSKSPAYRAWKSMNRRCSATSGYHYERYAARGIGVCERWRSSFENFIADMGPMPGPGYSVDRIDNDRGYEPGNCRWATKSTQARNRSTSRRLTCAGFTLSLSDWADVVGLPAQVIRQRIDRDGWPIERALLEPLDPQRGRFGVRAPDAELVEALTGDPDRVKKLAAAYLKRHGLAVPAASAT